MSISKEVLWPKIVTTSGEIPMKRRYAFRDMSYLDTLEQDLFLKHKRHSN